MPQVSNLSVPETSTVEPLQFGLELFDLERTMERVLDLSRTAMSAMVGWTLVTDRDALRAGIIQLDRIEVVPSSTPLGPVPRPG